MSKEDIVELEIGEDGTYAPKGSKKSKKQNIKKKDPGAYGYGNHTNKPMIFKESHADEFLNGIDAGLDFIEKVVPRVERFLRLRG